MAEEYPDTVVQFGAWFPDDAACLDYLAWLRLDLDSYQTAWTMLHRYRRAMVMPERATLSGVVEVDDMFVGGRNKPGRAGRSAAAHKTPVLVMAEVRSRGIGRCRLVVIPRVDGASLGAALRDKHRGGQCGAQRRTDRLGPVDGWLRTCFILRVRGVA
jgi:hypothetical protein